MKINFHIKYHTVLGEELFILGNNFYLGDNDPSKAVKLSWYDEDYWRGSVNFPDDFDDEIHYRYILKDKKGIEKSFGGLVRRATYLSDSATAFKIFNEHYDELGECYQSFFPALKNFAFHHLSQLNNS